MLLLTLAALLWLAGALLRLLPEARFLQLEEYQGLRYLRRLFARRSRWLPLRPLLAWLGGSALLLLLTGAPASPLPEALTLPVALVAAWPPPAAESKRGFRATWRARRLLLVAFLLTVAAAALLLYPAANFARVPLRPVLLGIAGLLMLLLAPLLLVCANLILRPVEATLRRRFIAHARRTLEHARPTVIGITGSFGKTSTKLILQHILNGRYRAGATPKSYNTLMGVCLAINRDLAEDFSLDYYIVEMGAYVPGEIAEICALARPRISLVTGLGAQHLERFGSIANIVAAKYEIIRALPPDGLAVLVRDNPHLREMAARGYPQHILTVSCAAPPDDATPDDPRLVATDIRENLEGLRFTVQDCSSGQREPFTTDLLGRHNVSNILLATAVALHEGLSLREVAWRVRSLQPAEARLERRQTPAGITIINDGYSANPEGARHALRVLGMHTGRRLLITPGMVELGERMETENYALGEAAARHASDVILIGARGTRPLHDGLLAAGFPPSRLRVMESLGEALTWYQTELTAGDTVLFLNDLPENWR